MELEEGLGGGAELDEVHFGLFHGDLLVLLDVDCGDFLLFGELLLGC